MKNSNDTSGYRTRDLPACSAPPRAPQCWEEAVQNGSRSERKHSQSYQKNVELVIKNTEKNKRYDMPDLCHYFVTFTK